MKEPKPRLLETLFPWKRRTEGQPKSAGARVEDQASGEPDQSLEARLDKLQDAANTASGHVRNVYLTFLLFGLYLAIIFGSTTHEQLLRESPVTLPLLNVGLPLLGFYWIAPALFVLLHLNLMLQLYLLADKLHRLDRVIEKAEGAGLGRNIRDDRRSLLFPFTFSHLLVGHHHGHVIRTLLWLIVWITVVFVPLVILLAGQLRFLPYHDAWTTTWHRVLVFLDVLLLLIFWRRVRYPADLVRTRPLRWLWHQAKALPIGLAALALSCLIFTFPGDGTGDFGDPMDERLLAVAPDSLIHHSAAQPMLWPTRYLFDQSPFFGRNLVVRETSLVASWPTQAQIDQYGEDLAWQNFGAPPDLRGRDLRYADLSDSIFVRGDLRGTNLERAILERANFQGADLEGANLQGADLWSAKLQDADLADADLGDAYLKRTDLRGAGLQGADLDRADLEGADLRGADLLRASLQGAVVSCDLYSVECITNLGGVRLEQANLQGADLQAANLQGADLWGANLHGANLASGRLQGASLLGAHLQGAILSADLQGADLQGAELEGADLRGASLQGADLSEAHLWRAFLDHREDLGESWHLADLRGVGLDSIENLDGWIEEATQELAGDRTRSQVAERLRDVLRDDRPEVPHFPDEWRSTPNVMFERGDPLPRELGWGAPAWASEGGYDEELATFLGELACSMEATMHLAQGLARRALWDETRLYAQRLAARLIDDCPPAAELPDDLRKRLEDLAARSPSADDSD